MNNKKRSEKPKSELEKLFDTLAFNIKEIGVYELEKRIKESSSELIKIYKRGSGRIIYKKRITSKDDTTERIDELFNNLENDISEIDIPEVKDGIIQTINEIIEFYENGLRHRLAEHNIRREKERIEKLEKRINENKIPDSIRLHVNTHEIIEMIKCNHLKNSITDIVNYIFSNMKDNYEIINKTTTNLFNQVFTLSPEIADIYNDASLISIKNSKKLIMVQLIEKYKFYYDYCNEDYSTLLNIAKNTKSNKPTSRNTEVPQKYKTLKRYLTNSEILGYCLQYRERGHYILFKEYYELVEWFDTLLNEDSDLIVNGKPFNPTLNDIINIIDSNLSIEEIDVIKGELSKLNSFDQLSKKITDHITDEYWKFSFIEDLAPFLMRKRFEKCASIIVSIEFIYDIPSRTIRKHLLSEFFKIYNGPNSNKHKDSLLKYFKYSVILYYHVIPILVDELVDSVLNHIEYAYPQNDKDLLNDLLDYSSYQGTIKNHKNATKNILKIITSFDPIKPKYNTEDIIKNFKDNDSTFMLETDDEKDMPAWYEQIKKSKKSNLEKSQAANQYTKDNFLNNSFIDEDEDINLQDRTNLNSQYDLIDIDIYESYTINNQAIVETFCECIDYYNHKLKINPLKVTDLFS